MRCSSFFEDRWRELDSFPRHTLKIAHWSLAVVSKKGDLWETVNHALRKFSLARFCPWFSCPKISTIVSHFMYVVINYPNS